VAKTPKSRPAPGAPIRPAAFKAPPTEEKALGGLSMASLQQAGAHFRAGRFLDAANIYRDVIRQRPKVPDLHNNLGVALKAAGYPEDALPCFRRAVRLRRDYVAAHVNLATTLELLDKPVEALDHRIDAWRIDPENVDMRDGLITALRRCPFGRPHAPARSALAHLFDRHDVDHQALSGAAIRLWRTNPSIAKQVDVAEESYAATPFPDMDAPPRAFKPLTDFLADTLIQAALSKTVAVDPGLEAAIVFTRRELLFRLSAGRPLRASEDWLCALALQARAVEWIWPEIGNETADLKRLDAEFAADPKGPDRSRALVRALFRPMESDPDAPRLRSLASQLPYAASLPHDVEEGAWATLLRRSFLHPHTEATLAAAMRAATPIASDVSAKVQGQYEANPYPRWLSVGQRPAVSLAEHLNRVLPGAPVVKMPGEAPRILVAGCGTGRHAIQTALRYRDASVTAIDLSRNSLAYAKRMAQDRAVRNIAFLQGDILALGRMQERFDLVESSGVLHHLRDPMAGWQVLRDLMASNGLMRIALYSRWAREGFATIRAEVPESAPLPERIRAARHAVFNLSDGHPARALLRTADFYAASGVRDALLHEQEIGVDPAWLGSALEGLGLRFLGFELPDPGYLELYRHYKPTDSAGLDLETWDQIEREHPDMFLGMYQFWVQAED